MAGAGNVVRNGVVDASAVPHTEPYGPPAATQPKTRRQMRAASITHTIEASGERSQVICFEHRGPTTNPRASRA